LDAGSSDYSRVVGAPLRLQAEELSKQQLVGLDPREGLVEIDKDGDVKNPVRVQVQVLDTVVLEETLEEKSLAERPSPRSTNRANIGISSGFFSIGYGSPAAARHMSISFS
jgi:small ligand-binding sensory domain FIST